MCEKYSVKERNQGTSQRAIAVTQGRDDGGLEWSISTVVKSDWILDVI